MSPYTKNQIIKHALQYYIERPNADPKDLCRERLVLWETKAEITRLMMENGIIPKEQRT
ncbi:hypothetical protein [Enterococcus sp.]|uniref:hypothetical protein n=1 Tax=Enterococcus sp. TaxID=35783 RepID=UPI003C74F1C6